jgi:hypothetical protein
LEIRKKIAKQKVNIGLLVPLAIAIGVPLLLNLTKFDGIDQQFGGFFDLEAMSLSGANFLYFLLFYKRFKHNKKIATALIVISISIGLSVYCLAPKDASYLQAQDNHFSNSFISYVNGTGTPIINQTFDAFLNDSRMASDPNHCGYVINDFFGNVGVYSSGVLGILFGTLSVMVTYLGSQCVNVDPEDAKTLIEYSSMLSIIVSVMIFASNSRTILVSTKYAFVLVPLLLAVLLLALGKLASPKDKQKAILSSTNIMSFTISFMVGALFGSLVMPFTRTATTALEKRNPALFYLQRLTTRLPLEYTSSCGRR